LGRRDLDTLHDAERLGDLQRIAEPALHVPPLDDPGGWLAGGIAWHISVMWVLFVDGAAYCSMASAAGIFAGTSARADRAQ
jgi:thiosulfate reductase cytochrome b subunit